MRRLRGCRRCDATRAGGFEPLRFFPKDKILELYLNQINLGNGAFGVEAAAQRYFGKSARDLNVAEAATLAGIPRSPTRYNPRRNPDLSVERRNLILDLMAQERVLSDPDSERWATTAAARTVQTSRRPIPRGTRQH